MFRPNGVPALVAAVLAAGCTSLLPGGGSTSLDVSFSNLIPIDKAVGHYEGWVAGPEAAPQSLGKFLQTADGKQTTLDGTLKTAWSADIPSSRVSQIFFTLEQPGDTDAVPSKQVFLRGSVVHSSKLTVAPPLDLGLVKELGGSYLLLNPVSAKEGDWNGIWFEKYENGKYSVGLDLPDAPAGYMYAGWVIMGDTVLPTGKFQRPDEMDDWAGYSGLSGTSLPVNFPGPPSPGEDFNQNLPSGIPAGWNEPNLAGARIVISLESAAVGNEATYPSPVRIFEGTVPSPSAMNVTYNLDNVVGSKVPSLAATFK